MCMNCPHGFNQKLPYNNSDLNEMIEIILREGYVSWEEEEIQSWKGHMVVGSCRLLCLKWDYENPYENKDYGSSMKN